MDHTPERLDRIIAAVENHTSPLPYENDTDRANEKILKLWTALNNILSPDGGVFGTIELINQAQEALASARKWEE